MCSPTAAFATNVCPAWRVWTWESVKSVKELALGRHPEFKGELKPGVLVRDVVQDHLHDHAELAFVSGGKKVLEVLQTAVQWVDRAVIRNIVPIIAQRRREERHQPDGIDSQVPQIVELLSDALEVADSVAIAVVQPLPFCACVLIRVVAGLWSMEHNLTTPTLDSILRFRETLLSERTELDLRISALEKAIEQFQIAVAPDRGAGIPIMDLPCVKPGEYRGMDLRQALPRYGWARSGKAIPFRKLITDMEAGGVNPGQPKRSTNDTPPRKTLAQNLKIALWTYENNHTIDKEPKGKLMGVDEEKIVVRFLPPA
jgi:hypothetical protein